MSDPIELGSYQRALAASEKLADLADDTAFEQSLKPRPFLSFEEIAEMLRPVDVEATA